MLAAQAAVAVYAFGSAWAGYLAAGSRGTQFVSLYAAARLAATRGGAAVYDLAAQRQVQEALTAGWQPAARFLPYAHPPVLTALLGPLGHLDLASAYAVTSVLSLLMAAAAALVLARAAGFGARWTAATVGLVVASVPVQVTVVQGQSDALLLLLVAAGAWAWTRGRTGWAGACLGLCLIKPQLVIVVPLFLLARRARPALLGFAAAGSAAFLASLAVTGLAGWQAYLGLLLPWLAGGPTPIDNETAFTVRGLLDLAPGGRPLAIALVLLAAPLAAASLGWRPHRSRLDFAVALALSVVLSPYENLHDLSLLIAPLVLGAGYLASGQARLPRLTACGLAGAYALLQLAGLAGPLPGVLAALALTAVLVAERLSVPAEKVELGESTLRGARARRVVVLPAYRAEKTLRDVIARIPRDEVDRILLVDDASSDRTAQVALELGIDVIRHPRNLGYGGNQKTCYANALLMGAEVVVMLHPDGQYDPELVPALCREIELNGADLAMGSRWLGLDPARAGMPAWKRLGNRTLTWLENRYLGLQLSEYHTGYRAYSRRFLETVPYEENSDDFVFDSQILVQASAFGFRVTEIAAVGRYFEDMSSIGFKTSVVYGLKTLAALARHLLHRAGLGCRWLEPKERPAAALRVPAVAGGAG